jgi:hypothetical protein
MSGTRANRDLISDTLWLDRRGVIVTPHLLAEALEIIESEYGVGRALNQRDIADAAIALIHARQRVEAEGRHELGVPFEIRPREPVEPR